MRFRTQRLYSICVAAGLAGAAALGFSSQVQEATVYKPYTLTTVDFYKKDGAVIDTETTTTYRRNDGAIVIVKNALKDWDYGINMRTVQLPDGRYILVSDDAKMKSTTMGPNSAASQVRTLGLNPATCASPAGTILGEGQLSGHRSVVVTVPLAGKDGFVGRDKQTLLPDFDCATASHEVQEKDKNGQWVTIRGI